MGLPPPSLQHIILVHFVASGVDKLEALLVVVMVSLLRAANENNNNYIWWRRRGDKSSQWVLS